MHSTLYQNILSKALVTVPPKQYLLKLSVQCHIQRNVCNSFIWSKKFYQRALRKLYFTKINISKKFHFEQKSLQRQWLNCGRSQIHNWEITLVTEYSFIPLWSKLAVERWSDRKSRHNLINNTSRKSQNMNNYRSCFWIMF